MPHSNIPNLPNPNIVKVLLPLPLDDAYDYYPPLNQEVQEGDIVIVPFHSRERVGVVWQISKVSEISKGSEVSEASEIAKVSKVAEASAASNSSEALSSSPIQTFRIKEISAVIPDYSIPGTCRQFVDWVAAYTLHPRGHILKMVLSSREALKSDPIKTGYSLVCDRDLPLEMQCLNSSQVYLVADLIRLTGCTRYRIQKWIQEGFLAPTDIADKGVGLPVLPDPGDQMGNFSTTQKQAIQQICDHIQKDRFSVVLIDGVTGSGKTEVYLEGVAHTLKQGKQVLVLLPEIALSPQTIARFRQRFGIEPAVWHSELTLNQRKKTWRGICKGDIHVVVGARSALFLPFPRLGLIVVDEEHEHSYKQEEGVIYQARDMAVARAKLEQIPILLVSATPSLESIVNWQQGRYQRIHLPERFGTAQLPVSRLIDCRQKENIAPGCRWLSAPLIAAVEENLQQKEQALLFLNRRGYAPLTLCRHCGHRLQCLHCSTWLVEHRHAAELRCHQCGYAMAKPKSCPHCHVADQLVPCGPGVERLQEEVIKRFPNARLLVMASDLIQSTSHLRQCLEKIHERQVDIIIGTQMMAKGHHFAYLTLVGVIDADLGLSGGDLRACEKTYQLLHQVAGRAGRAERPGRVLIQTHQPEHPVMQALLSHDRDQFIAEETRMRLQSEMPPFSRLTALILSSPSAEEVEKAARFLARQAPKAQGFHVMGPVPAPLHRVRGRYRWRLLLRSPRQMMPQPYLRQWLKDLRLPSSVRLDVDVDPYSFL